MFKRQYFIYAETENACHTVEVFRQFWWRSFLPQPAEALKDRMSQIADQYETTIENVVVKSFNKV